TAVEPRRTLLVAVTHQPPVVAASRRRARRPDPVEQTAVAEHALRPTVLGPVAAERLRVGRHVRATHAAPPVVAGVAELIGAGRTLPVGARHAGGAAEI